MPKHATRNRIAAAVLGLLLGGAALGASASQSLPTPDAVCPPLVDGALVRGHGPELFLVQQGTLHWIPDLATLQERGLEALAPQWLADDCLMEMSLGEPLPSVLASREPVATPASGGRGLATAPLPVPTPVPQVPNRRLGPKSAAGVPSDSALLLTASALELPAGAAVTLSARATEAEEGSFTLTIQRLRSAGGPAGGLVANCAGATVCVGQTRVSEPITVSYLATLYRCDARGACAAERSSAPVTVRWR